MSASELYSNMYGDYATKDRILPYVKENMLANAYYEHLTEINKPGDEEIQEYYEANKNSYDKVDYRSFAFTTQLAEDATEEDITKAMDELKKSAQAMEEKVKAGEDFETLCVENASEEQKENYGGADKEGSLTEGGSYAGSPAAISAWLFDESRKEGDLTILPDETNHRYYVAQFIKRTNDADATSQSISSTLSNQKAGEYVKALTEKYEVTDVAGKLAYLTIEESTTEAVETGTEAATETAVGNASAEETESSSAAE